MRFWAFPDNGCILTLSLEPAAGSRRNPQPGWLRYVAHASSVRVWGIFQMPGAKQINRLVRTVSRCTPDNCAPRGFHARSVKISRRMPCAAAAPSVFLGISPEMPVGTGIAQQILTTGVDSACDSDKSGRTVTHQKPKPKPSTV